MSSFILMIDQSVPLCKRRDSAVEGDFQFLLARQQIVQIPQCLLAIHLLIGFIVRGPSYSVGIRV